MKNKLFKTLVTFAVFATFIICIPCVAHAAKAEIIPSDDGNILKIHTEKSRDLSKIGGFARDYSYNHIIVTGKMNRSDFFDLDFMARKCKSIDIYGVEVTQIPERFLYERRELEKVVLPATLKVIREYAFMGCLNLQIDELPESLECIGPCAFENCWSLHLTVPDNVKVCVHAFGGCQNVTFPKSAIAEVEDIKPKESSCSCI